MLEDTNHIDMAVRDNNKLHLVITDAGLIDDEERRIELLHAKLRTYITYILSEEFAKEHPGVGPSETSIRVMCRTEPSEKMRGISQIEVRQNNIANAVIIPVEFQVFRP